MTFTLKLGPSVTQKVLEVTAHLPSSFHGKAVAIPPEACGALVDQSQAGCCSGPGGRKEGQLAESQGRHLMFMETLDQSCERMPAGTHTGDAGVSAFWLWTKVWTAVGGGFP